MKIRPIRFNPNLVAACLVAIALLPACKTESEKSKQKKKMVASVRLHQELNRDPMGNTEEIQIDREHPVKLTVAKEPFLTEKHVKEAKVIDVLGGFALSLQFNRQG